LIASEITFDLQALIYMFMKALLWTLTGWWRVLHMIHTVLCALMVLLADCCFISLTSLLQAAVLVSWQTEALSFCHCSSS